MENCSSDHTATTAWCQANNGSDMNSETLMYSKNMCGDRVSSFTNDFGNSANQSK